MVELFHRQKRRQGRLPQKPLILKSPVTLELLLIRVIAWPNSGAILRTVIGNPRVSTGTEFVVINSSITPLRNRS
jgi:hypothetical protein